MMAKSMKNEPGTKVLVSLPMLASGPKLYAGKPSKPGVKETEGGRGTPINSVKSR